MPKKSDFSSGSEERWLITVDKRNSNVEEEEESEREESWISFITKLKTKADEQQHTNKRKHKKNLKQEDREKATKAKNV